MADYVDVDPQLGTLADLDALVADAHEARYIFRTGRDGGPPNNWQSAFGGPAWTLDEPSGEHYLRFVFSNEPVERLRGLRDRLRRALE